MAASFAQLRELALSQVGTVESPAGSNRTKYGRWYGMDGQPWCAMFTSWLMAELGLIGQCNFSTSKGYAYTPTGVAGFKARGKFGYVRDGAKPRLGAHVFFQFSGPRVHHVGIVIGINPDGSIVTVEGNTSAGSAGSQRDGGGVYRRTRRSGIVGYGYIDYEAGGGPAPGEEDDEMGAFHVEVPPGEHRPIGIPPVVAGRNVWWSIASDGGEQPVRWAIGNGVGKWRQIAEAKTAPGIRHPGGQFAPGDAMIDVGNGGTDPVGVLIEFWR